jgi:pimeloyl-ACP methyl ester carboxylesterase
MATFILLHGAWHGAWCWERVEPLLKAQGHQVLTPDLPGTGSDAAPHEQVTLQSWVAFLVGIIEKQSEQVVLVGHSRAGIVITQVAEHCPELIKGLVYVAAFLPQNQESLVSIYLPYFASKGLVLNFHPRVSADGLSSTVRYSDIGNIFYNTTPEGWAERAASLVGLESIVTHETPVSITKDHYGKVPRVYIECLQDRVIPIDLQRKMVSKMPCQAVFTMDTDHSPFYSVPDLLAVNLIKAAQLF